MSTDENVGSALVCLDAVTGGKKLALDHMSEQEEAVNRLICTQPEMGILLDRFGSDFLVATLELKNEIFAAEYPSLAAWQEQERHVVANLIRQHCDECPHCQSRAAVDKEWDDVLEQSFKQSLSTHHKAAASSIH